MDPFTSMEPYRFCVAILHLWAYGPMGLVLLYRALSPREPPPQSGGSGVVYAPALVVNNFPPFLASLSWQWQPRGYTY